MTPLLLCLLIRPHHLLHWKLICDFLLASLTCALIIIKFFDLFQEAFGRYLDLHELYNVYINSKFGQKIEYSAYLDIFSDPVKIPRKLKLTGYSCYLVIICLQNLSSNSISFVYLLVRSSISLDVYDCPPPPPPHTHKKMFLCLGLNAIRSPVNLFPLFWTENIVNICRNFWITLRIFLRGQNLCKILKEYFQRLASEFVVIHFFILCLLPLLQRWYVLFAHWVTCFSIRNWKPDPTYTLNYAYLCYFICFMFDLMKEMPDS